jgi:hypothetical protein
MLNLACTLTERLVMNIKFALLSLLGLAATSSALSAPLAKYEVIAIAQTQKDSPYDYRRPTALSAHGWIAGVESRGGQYPNPFRCDSSGTCGPVTPSGYVGDAGINSSGTVVYTQSAPKTNWPARGYIVDANGVSTSIEPNLEDCPWAPQSWYRSSAGAINRDGLVLGGSGRCGYERVVIFSYGIVWDVPLPSGALADRSSEGYDINDFGHIVGEAYDQDGQWRSFHYDGVQSRWLDFSATHINNLGQIGGYKVDADSQVVPVLYSNGVKTEYPILGRYGILPTGMNRFGEMVGNANIDGTTTGVLMSKGRTKRLQSLLRDYDRRNWTIERAGDINGSGQIVCSATQKSTGHEFVVLLVPLASAQ